MRIEMSGSMKTWILLAVIIFTLVVMDGCDNKCKDDPDCVYVNDQVGWIEVQVDDGHCECAD